jgi:hypothetical protein
MEFYRLVLERVSELVNRYDLQVVEQFKNVLKLKSERIVVTLCYNQPENSCSAYVGDNAGHSVHISDGMMQEFFNSALKISHVTPVFFVNNLAAFFEGEGRQLIAGDPHALRGG